MSEQFDIRWIDRGREPRNPPNPDYPDGIHVDVSRDSAPSCRADLPYPARRCGVYKVVCRRCGMSVAVTTAGRADDPRSLTMACGSARPPEGEA